MQPSPLSKAVVTAIVASSFFSTNTFAEQEQTVVITGNRIAQPIQESLANIQVISRQDIERILPESINDLLITVAGLDIVTQGGAGQTSAVFARGSNSDHTLILVNGVRVGSATDGRKALSAISVNQIERIEIVRGPRASVWGSDAIGAVIHIFTRQVPNGEQSITASVGSQSFKSGSYTLGLGNEKLNHSINVSGETSEGIDVLDDSSEFGPDSELDNDGYRRMSVSLVANYLLSDTLTLDYILMANQGNVEFDNAWGANESDFKDHMYNIKYSYRSDGWHSEIAVGQSKDELMSYGNGVAKNDPNVFATKRDAINAAIGYEFNDHFNTLFGYDRYKDDVAKSSLNFAKKERTTQAYYWISVADFDALTFETSLRYDDVKEQESDRTFALSVGYDFNENLQLVASRGKGFKAPTFNDLYYPSSPFFGGNTELRSEVAFTNELALVWQQERHKIYSSIYQSDFYDLINFELDADFVLRPVNIDRANVDGYEIEYAYVGENWTHNVSYASIDATESLFDANGNVVGEDQLIRRAKQHFNYQVGYNADVWSVFAQVIHKGERPDDDFSTWPATRVMLDSYTQLNVSAHYLFSEDLKLSLKINDVLDEAPTHVLNYNSPGQQSYLTLGYTF